MDGLEERFEKRMDGFDERLRSLETGQARLEGRFDGIDGQLAFLRDYITGRNARNELPEAAQGDD